MTFYEILFEDVNYDTKHLCFLEDYDLALEMCKRKNKEFPDYNFYIIHKEFGSED